MLTFFTTAKPFVDHINAIQRNALKSWTLVHPDAEVILFRNDEGAAGVARELGFRHKPHTEKNERGTNRADYIFNRAQEIARRSLLCCSNCDILRLPDFLWALDRGKGLHAQFLLLGRRWDTEINEAIDFSKADWVDKVRSRALAKNRQRSSWFIDYFAFTRGLFGSELPPLLIGRVGWDN
jgi:hypothetical protein